MENKYWSYAILTHITHTDMLEAFETDIRSFDATRMIQIYMDEQIGNYKFSQKLKDRLMKELSYAGLIDFRS